MNAFKGFYPLVLLSVLLSLSPGAQASPGTLGGAFIVDSTVDAVDASPGDAPRADWAAEGNAIFVYFGWSANTAGDVNGDGSDDLIVGAPNYSHGQVVEGLAFVYHGSATGLSPTADWTAESDHAYTNFGFSVRAAGDVNGDGYGDVIIGAPGYSGGLKGRAYVYYGSANGLSATPDWTAHSGQDSDWIGFAVNAAGDVNGDGYDDVIVGAPLYDNGQVDEGRAFVFHGSATGLSVTPDWIVESDQDSALFGFAVGAAGDVNGDGYDDVIVGAELYDNGQVDEGRAFVYRGSATGLSVTPDWTAESDQDFAQFGWAASRAGDVNGDGYDDVIVGAPLYDNAQTQTDEGRTFVYHGSASGLSATPDWFAQSNQSYAQFGFAASGAGDVNGDGFDDVIVGAPYYDWFQVDGGAAFAFFGSPTGLSRRPKVSLADDQAYANFGFAVGAAGDVNADDLADFVVGAPYYDHGEDDEGAAFVWYGHGG